MFDKLVLSNRNHPSNRTKSFFLGTSLVYLLSAASAVALSIIVSNPQMADQSLYPTANLIVPAAQLDEPERPLSGRASQPAPRADYRNPMPLNEMLKPGADLSAPRVKLTGPPLASPEPIGNLGGDGNNLGYGVPTGGLPTVGSVNEDPNSRIGDPPRPEPVAASKQREAQPEKVILRMASTVLQGKAIESPRPPYPIIAKQAGVEGSVPVEVIIAPDGRVESVRAISGHPLLKTAAADAAKNWRFEPTLLNGVAVRVTGIVTFNFRLRE